MTVVRFPTEKCRLPGETLTQFNMRKMAYLFTSSRADPVYLRDEGRRWAAWDPPLLDELAQGVQDSHPYP